MPTILLATDLTAHGDRALARAALLAAGRKAGLALVHVVGRELRNEAAMQAALAEGGEALARYVAEAELPDGLAVDARAVAGEPDTAIVQAAGEVGAEMVVLGGANADLLERLFRRNVVHQVVRNAPCPVLVVHRRALRPYRRVLVATDLSLPARRAFELALRSFPGCEITLFHVARTDTPAMGADDVRLQLDDMVTAGLARLSAEGAPAPASVTPLVETGTARDLIAAAVERLEIELAVVGTLGLGGVAGVLLGGTAEALIGALRCDVLAVKDQSSPG